MTNPFPTASAYVMLHEGTTFGPFYLVKARMTLAEIWRKNMDAMKESERTRTMNGSL